MNFQIKGAAECLGCFMGPSAGSLQWVKPWAKWQLRAHLVAGAQTSAQLASIAYNVRVASVLSYLAQFLVLPAKTLRQQWLVLQKILHVPLGP